jgi:hypothetical protein
MGRKVHELQREVQRVQAEEHRRRLAEANALHSELAGQPPAGRLDGCLPRARSKLGMCGKVRGLEVIPEE